MDAMRFMSAVKFTRGGIIVMIVEDLLSQFIKTVDLVEDINLGDVGIGSLTLRCRGLDAFRSVLAGLGQY